MKLQSGKYHGREEASERIFYSMCIQFREKLINESHNNVGINIAV
jgi:hypothetical protein